jgi:hypothetical protein
MNSSWRTSRQIITFFIYFVILSLPFIIFAYFMLQKTETCFDGILNQDEKGIDCSGVCSLQCKGSYKDVKVSFARGMPTDVDLYNIFALLENSNAKVYFPRIPYTVKAYNRDGQLLVSASGTTSVLAGGRSAIYIPKLAMKQPPTIVDVNIEPTYVALKQDNFDLQNSIKTSAWTAQRGANQTLQVVVKVENQSVKQFSNVTVYTMLYDDTRTVYAVGKTLLPVINGRENTAAVFTWGNLPAPANADFVITQD